MQSLLARYLANPTSANARRVVRYYRVHSVRQMNPLELGLFRQALHHARLP